MDCKSREQYWQQFGAFYMMMDGAHQSGTTCTHTHTHREDEASEAEMCLKLSPGLAAGQQPISNQTQTLRV